MREVVIELATRRVIDDPLYEFKEVRTTRRTTCKTTRKERQTQDAPQWQRNEAQTGRLTKKALLVILWSI